MDKTKKKKKQGRPRGKDSDNSLYGLGLAPEQETKLLEILADKELSFRYVVRRLARKWLEAGGPSDFNIKPA